MEILLLVLFGLYFLSVGALYQRAFFVKDSNYDIWFVMLIIMGFMVSIQFLAMLHLYGRLNGYDLHIFSTVFASIAPVLYIVPTAKIYYSQERSKRNTVK